MKSDRHRRAPPSRRGRTGCPCHRGRRSLSQRRRRRGRTAARRSGAVGGGRGSPLAIAGEGHVRGHPLRRRDPERRGGPRKGGSLRREVAGHSRTESRQRGDDAQGRGGEPAPPPGPARLLERRRLSQGAPRGGPRRLCRSIVSCGGRADASRPSARDTGG